jgi:hypothetical protein
MHASLSRILAENDGIILPNDDFTNEKMNVKIRFPTREKPEKEKPSSKFRRIARVIMKTIVLEHRKPIVIVNNEEINTNNENNNQTNQSNNGPAYLREEHGGIKMWINSQTSEVSVRNQSNSMKKKKKKNHNNLNQHNHKTQLIIIIIKLLIKIVLK